MKVELNKKEAEALKELAEKKGMSEEAVMKQALRTYQMVEYRITNGERIYSPNEKERPRVQLGPENVPDDQIAECFEGMLDGKESKEDRWTNPDVVYAKMSGVADWCKPGFLINWGVKGIGYGQVCLYTKEDLVFLDHEHTSKEFAKKIFGHLIDTAHDG